MVMMMILLFKENDPRADTKEPTTGGVNPLVEHRGEDVQSTDQCPHQRGDVAHQHGGDQVKGGLEEQGEEVGVDGGEDEDVGEDHPAEGEVVHENQPQRLVVVAGKVEQVVVRTSGTFASSTSSTSSMLLMVVQQLVALLEAKEDDHREDDVEDEEGAVEGGHGVDAGHKGDAIKKAEEEGEK